MGGVLATGCATQRNVALPQDVTYVIVSIGGYDTDKDAAGDITFAKSGQFFGSTGCNRISDSISARGRISRW